MTQSTTKRTDAVSLLREALKKLYSSVDSCIELTPDVLQQARAALVATERAAIQKAGECIMCDHTGYDLDGNSCPQGHRAPAPDAEAMARHDEQVRSAALEGYQLVRADKLTIEDCYRFGLDIKTVRALSQPSPAVKSAEPTGGAA